MKKFFIILCGILVMGDAFGDIKPDRYKEPHILDESMQSAWNLQSNSKFNYLLDKDLYKELYDANYKIKKVTGTYDDEEAIVLIIARNIFENGGRFCMTQIQSANQNARRYTWIDYYHDEKIYNCEILCKSGYYGKTCSDTNAPAMTGTDSNTLDFGTPEILSSGKDENKTTPMVDVFVADNSKASPTTTATHTVLAVTKKMDHGVMVAPVRIEAERYHSGNLYSKINSVYTVSPALSTLLCAQGYKPNSNGTDCEQINSVFSSSVSSLYSNISNKWCEGYPEDGYLSSQHYKFMDVDCTKYTCTNYLYGFTSSNDKTCKQCEGGALAYIKRDGTCGKCTKGKIANETRDDCLDEDNVTQYSKDQMKSNGNRQCWLETDGRKFAGCVNGCPDSTPCYDGSCKSCN